MKISIRKSMFETNSSSMHSLFITNKKDLEKTREEIYQDLKKEGCYFCSNQVETKEDKAYLLAGVMLYNKKESYGDMEYEYDILLKILKDNNEIEILKNIDIKAQEYLDGGSDPACCDYFYHGTLFDCTCFFEREFRKYFNINFYQSDEPLNVKKEKLYKKLADFIYKDGVILTYDVL